MLALPYPRPLIVLSVFLKRRHCPPHRLRRASLAPSRLDRARSMPLHILRIRCWGFGPKDRIPPFAFISPWDASSRAWAFNVAEDRGDAEHAPIPQRFPVPIKSCRAPRHDLG